MGKGERLGGRTRGRGRMGHGRGFRIGGSGGSGRLQVRGLQGCGFVFIIFVFFLGIPGMGVTIASYTAFDDSFFSSMRYIGLTLLGFAAVFAVVGIVMCVVGKQQAGNATGPSNTTGTTTTGVVATVAPTVMVNQSGYTEQPGGFTTQPGGYTAQPGGYTAQPVGYTAQPGGYTVQPGGYTAQPGGYTAQPGGYTAQPGGYTAQPNGYNQDPGGPAPGPFGQYGVGEPSVPPPSYGQTTEPAYPPPPPSAFTYASDPAYPPMQPPPPAGEPV